MFFSEPPRTAYDLNFEFAGFPVRINPFFWLVALVLGANGIPSEDVVPGLIWLTWVLVMFVSILVHELGHAFAMRMYGQPARVVLYWLGGLAIPDSSPYAFGYGKSRSPREQIIISAAGPGAGFVLALLTLAAIFALGGHVQFEASFPVFWRLSLPPNYNTAIFAFFFYSLYINVLWGMINLLPIYPLDGGQIAREILVVQDPGRGIVWSLWLSVIAGGAVACWGLFRVMTEDGHGGLFIALMFGSLAYSSYTVLQQLGGGGFGGGGGYGGGRPW